MRNNDEENNNRIPRRVRNELRIRPIEVVSKRKIADCFYRIEFAGEALAGFASLGFDDHIKVFFPDPESGALHMPEVTEQGVTWKDGVRPTGRDYTPLYFDERQNRLTIDFYIHQGGVASDWATQAQPGDALAVGGPRGSLIVPTDYAFQLYVCDETGLPAFKRRQRSIRAEHVKLFAFTDEAAGRAYLDNLSGVAASWLGSGKMQPENLTGLIAELDSIDLPDEDYFIWLTGEGDAVKKLSDYFIEQRALDPDFVRAVAYWHRK
ncbi:siderophore-interacting protein [Brenneria izadpanahii]|uniref:siderophore-interacting protein n=1 Tax=Brenneria izadpanahii TaxID=2722756 RepID=UPI001FE87FF6|nr:siderophore-interacting protein [Brenneria izadpanahii]